MLCLSNSMRLWTLSVSKTNVLKSLDDIWEIHRMLRRAMKRRGRLVCEMEARCEARGGWGMLMYICESRSYLDGEYCGLFVVQLLRAIDEIQHVLLECP